MKTILVPVTGYEEIDNTALASARHIAVHFASHIHCLYVHPDARALIALSSVSDLGVAVGPGLFEAMEALDVRDKTGAESAKKIVEAFAAANKIPFTSVADRYPTETISWHECKGDVASIVSQGRLRELIVVSRPLQTSAWSKRDLQSILLESGRPVLFAPKAPPSKIGDVVAIAWKDTPESARAVTAAMPLLEAARRVVVLNAYEGPGNEAMCVECLESLSHELRWKSICSSAKYVIPAGRSTSNALFDSALEEHADLLVMGAYGHSRARELVFGGVTQDVLNQAPLPVLFFH